MLKQVLTNPTTLPLHGEVPLHSTAALVNQAFSCTRQPKVTCSYTCHILSASAPVFVNLWHTKHHLRHMRYLMHTYLSPSLLRDTVNKLSLKPRVYEGFDRTASIPTLKKQFQRL